MIVASRILIAPGVYRDSEILLDGRTIGGEAINTLLVIEAEEAGTVTIKGSEIYEPDSWTPVLNDAGEVAYYEHAWPYDLGFEPGGWKQHNPTLPYEHRKELMFINGEPLLQVLLEEYRHTPVAMDPDNYWKSLKFPEGTKTDAFVGVPQNINKYGLYEYLGLKDPMKLPEGAFSVLERDENGNKIVFNPPSGLDMDSALIEVAKSPYLLWLHYKSHVVLRGIAFEHNAGRIEAHGTVMFGHWIFPQKSFSNSDILIEDCDFRYNNNTQLKFSHGQNVTVRDTRVLYGAYGGINMRMATNVIFDNVETSYNNWRIDGGWSSGPIKIHDTLDMKVLDTKIIGNDGNGLWYDISCGNVYVDGLVSIGNVLGIDWEISRGLHVVNSVLVRNSMGDVGIVTGSEVKFENCIIGGDSAIGAFRFESASRSSGEQIKKLLGLPVIDKYYLDTLVIEDSVIFTMPQSGVQEESLTHAGAYQDGFEPGLFIQHHGNPKLYSQFLRDGVFDRGNVWYSNRAEPFGLVKLYGKNWRQFPIEP